MPPREPELYKDKVEVSLDGRQIFYLFFGGAVIVGVVFVLGVLVGRRVEARGHVDRAKTHAASDPLAALDRLEGDGQLSFRASLVAGKEQPTDVEKEIERRAAAKTDVKKGEDKKSETKAKAEPKPEGKADEAKAAVKTEPKAEDKAAAKTERKPDETKAGAKTEDKAVVKTESKTEDKPVTKPDGKTEDKPVTKTDGKTEDKAVTKIEGKTDGKTEDKAVAKTDGKTEEPKESKTRYTLQLSSFQDRAEAEAFLSSVKSAGYQAQITQAEVEGKGTFFRVRMGSYRSMDAANEAKSEFERTAKKSASVMKL